MDADLDTLTSELATVTKRHDADLSHVEIVSLLFDFADSYAEAYDVPVEVEHVEKPSGEPAAVLHYTGRDADDVLPSPVGRYSVADLKTENWASNQLLDTTGDT